MNIVGDSKRVNLGVYYTPESVVPILHGMIKKHVDRFDEYVLLDTSCGDGIFFKGVSGYKAMIGADIDFDSLDLARASVKDCKFIRCDGLQNVNRRNYDKRLEGSKLIVISNPPYNDTTSQVKSDIKERVFFCDSDLRCRDMGISFLRSYDKLSADYVCVLHPLSYLIKRSNFNLLKGFREHYKLIDSLIIPSSTFSHTSKASCFPILIGLYKRDSSGMSYEDVCSMEFFTIEQEHFRIKDYVGISKFIPKYPNKRDSDTVTAFYPLRDINALKRSRTFMDVSTIGMVYANANLTPFYCYVDVFKRYIKRVPYYLCNLEVFIDYDYFVKISDCFVYESSLHHPGLVNPPPVIPKDHKSKIEEYFNYLLK